MSLRAQTLWSMLPLLAVTAANLLSVPLFYRYLGAERYGIWFYVLTLSGAFGFMDLGLGVAVGRFVGVALGKNDSTAVREYWGTGNLIAIPLLLLMSVVFCIVGAILGSQWFHVKAGEENLLRWCFIAAAPGLFLSYYGQFWNILAQAHLDFKFLAAARTVTTLGSLAISVVLARSTGSPLLLIWWSSAVAAVQLAVYIFHALRNYGLHWNLADARWDRAMEMRVYTVKTFASLLIGAFSGSIDRVVLGKLVPAAQFTYYNIGGNVGLRMQSLGAAILGPVFHQSNRAFLDAGGHGIRRIHNEAFSLVYGWCLLAIGIAFLWGAPLLQLWLGEELSRLVAPLLLPIVIACSIQVISSISAAQLSSLDRQGTLVVLQVARVVLIIGGGFAGWKVAGLPGFAWGVLLSRLVDLAQDVLLMMIVGPVAWMTPTAGRTFAIQGVLACVFFLISGSATGWRVGVGFGILHFICGASPLLYTWIGPHRFKALGWSSPK